MTERKDLVDERMIEMFARRFMEIQSNETANVAKTWVRTFLNPEDITRVTLAVREGRWKKEDER